MFAFFKPSTTPKNQPRVKIAHCKNNGNYLYYEEQGKTIFIQMHEEADVQYYQKKLLTLRDMALQSTSGNLLQYRLTKVVNDELISSITEILETNVKMTNEEKEENQEAEPLTLVLKPNDPIDPDEDIDPTDDYSEAGSDEEPEPKRVDNINFIEGRYYHPESLDEGRRFTAMLRQMR